MDIKSLVTDEKLIGILNTYSDADAGEKLGETIRSMYQNSNNARMIVPVLGMQGMGKSTLINSILGKNILPNDADETTCVPVEVCYGEEEYAKVYFQDSKKEKIVYSREELNAFVDNNENPANRKKVSKIVLYDSLELLKSGLVIVDLPGVGSLTAENAETTKEYIKNLCTAIFVIPTTPTIRKQEVVFIKAVWSQFPTAIFVQNHWDENERELAESVEYNTLILKNIAKELNVEFNDNIIVVNAYNALVGRLKNDEGMINGSNLPDLLKALSAFSVQWEMSLNKNICNRIIGAMNHIKLAIKNKLDEIDLSREELIKKRTQEYNDLVEWNSQIRKKIRTVERYLDNKESEIKQKAEQVSKDCASNIRKDVYNLIDKGITDGTQLSDAFNHYQEEYVPAAFDSMFADFMSIKMELENMLDEIEEMTIENDMSIDNESFDKKSQFKYEKSFGPIAGIGAGIGGFFTGQAIAGAAALGSWAGPLGVIAAVGITAVGCLIGSWAKKMVRKGRGNETKSEIKPIIDDIQIAVYNTIVDGFGKVKEDVDSVLNKIKKIREEEELKFGESINSFEEDDSENFKVQLQQDMAYLSNKLKETI